MERSAGQSGTYLYPGVTQHAVEVFCGTQEHKHSVLFAKPQTPERSQR